MPKKKIYQGRTFGSLLVLNYVKRVNNREVHLCRCSCSKTIWVSAGNLSSGNTKSCGCLKKGREKYSVVPSTITIPIDGTIKGLKEVCDIYGLPYANLVVYKQRKGLEAVQERVVKMIKELQNE